MGFCMEYSVTSLRASTNSEGADESEIEGLWIEAARSNPGAFEPLYLRYKLRVYHYLRMRLNNDEDAADLTHQVFLQALTALPKYQQRGIPFAAWLFRIAHHSALKISRRHPHMVSWDVLPEALHPTSEQDPETWTLQQETLAWLRLLLEHLDTPKRELLVLRFAAGLTVPQIAAVIGKKPEAVKKQLRRLLQSLKENYHHEQLS